MSEFFLGLLAIAFLQNLVLSTGLGSSLLIRIARRPRDTVAYSGVLCGFLVLSVLVTYPLDRLIGTEPVAKLLRPAMMIAAVALLYAVVDPLVHKLLPRLYKRIANLLPLAAFNNIVIGLLLILNHQFSASLGASLGIAVGTGIGFVLLTWLLSEGTERMDNPDMPAAFRGLPATLLYLGILALAFTGFETGTSLI